MQAEALAREEAEEAGAQVWVAAQLSSAAGQWKKWRQGMAWWAAAESPSRRIDSAPWQVAKQSVG